MYKTLTSLAIMLAMAVVVSGASMAFARVSPFYPWVTAKDSERLGATHAFSEYTAIGYVKGQKRTVALILTPSKTVIYLTPGQELGQEKYVFKDLQQGSTLKFVKTIQDMDGKETVITKEMEITGQ